MKQLSTLLLILLFTQLGYSQYTYSTALFQNAGNPGSVNTESDAPGLSGWTNIVLGPQAANIWSPATEIPFAFDFFGAPVTHFKASQNGLVTFDTATTLLPNPNDPLPSANLPDNTVAVVWDAFTATPSTGTGDDIRIKTFGTAPNRQFWIKWYSFEIGNPTISFTYFALVLEETTNKMYVVDQYSSTTPPSSATVGLQLNATTAVEYSSNFVLAGNGTATTDNDYVEFLPVLLLPDDAGIAALANPVSPITAGIQNVEVTLQNFGINALNTANIAWEVDGVAQTGLAYTGPLAAGASATVTLGTYNFPVGTTTIKAWTSLPNGNADSNTANDTLLIDVCTSLAGTYTIGTGGDYASFTEAAEALQSCNISGPVVFNVLPGTYNENLFLSPVPGASATNTITFDGGNAAGTILTWNATGSIGTITLAGADYVTIKNLTIENTGTTDAWGVHLFGEANWNTIDSCIITLNPAPGVIDVQGVVASGTNTSSFTEAQNASYTTISHNLFLGGEMAIHLEGQETNRTAGNRILYNTMSGQDDYGVYLDDQDSVQIIGNTVTGLKNIQSDGIYCFDLVDFIIRENNVYARDYGIYVSDGNFDGPTTLGASQLINNMAYSETDYGIFLDDVNNIQIYHNSAWGNPGIRVGEFTGLDIRNNIFASTADFAFESDEQITFTALDYNLYYTPASNTNFVDFGPTTYADLAAWQAAFPAINLNSLEGNPVFIAPTDLHVLGALANDAGDNSVGILVDIDGDTRPQASSTTVDIGADEYTPLNYDLRLASIDAPGSSCGLGTTEAVTITISNQGLLDVTGAVASFSVDGGAFVAQEIIPGTLVAGTTTSYTFTATADVAALGTHTITAFATAVAPADQNTSNDTLGISIVSIPTVSTFPYLETFENGEGGWRVEGPVSSWAFGTPAKTVITGAASGINAWVTGGLGTGLYGADENAWIAGPCFDMTNAPAAPWVALKIWWQAEFSWDGAVLQSSVDGGSSWQNVGTNGAPFNWYNDNTIGGLPGGQQIGWTGRTNATNTTGSNGWVQAAHPLDASLVGQADVRFRVAFGSDGTVFDDGFAFDDFGIGTLPEVDLGLDTVALCIGETLDPGFFGGTYLWSNGATTQSIDITNNTGADIIDSTIWVVVTDSLGLMGTDTIVVSIRALAPAVDAGQTLAADCNGAATGEATAVASGGAGTLTYLWNTNPPQNTEIATGLAAGIYTVTVTDSLGCSATDTVAITEPAALEVSLDSLTTILCAGDATGAIDITVAGGTAPYAFLWSNGETTEDLSGLVAGDYTGTITDANGCVLVSPVLTVGEPDSIGVALDALTDATCTNAADGAISITTSGGTAPYTFLWSNGETTEDLSGLAPGNYTGTITDANGCTFTSPVVRLGATDSLPTADFTFGFADGETVNFTNASSPNATSFAWDFGDGTGTSTDENPTYTYLANDTLTVTLIATGPCGSDTIIQTIELTSVRIDNLLSRNITIYPNPTTGAFEIAFGELTLNDVEISIADARGSIVYRAAPGIINGPASHPVTLKQELARGIYLVTVRSGTLEMHKRIQLK